MQAADVRREFAAAVRARQERLGTFVKLRDPAVIEILAAAGLDFVILDGEHAPFGRESIELAMLAARAARLPALVRVPEGSKTWVATALDCGAAGIMVPHVSDVETAERLARLMRFDTGGRGANTATRAAGYGSRDVATHLAAARDETLLICQIEDRAGAASAADIAAVDGVDALFLGPVDLSVSLGAAGPNDPAVQATCAEVLRIAEVQGVAGGLYLGAPQGLAAARAAGVTLPVIGSDHGFLASAARAARAPVG
ncbi:MAG: hypothetical protein CVT80_01605 [Alphaproteobacteria bacterium HGW-Alphaproteobacteria-2]|nr:MAG: hypothetical protein CVT80_01605 [Alphaproteobacteria bacterium HGW-Alphaproteobacteria-2]